MKKLSLLLLISLFILSNCSKDNEDTKPGKAPLAKAGNDITSEVGKTVQLNGSQSSDQDGDQLSYSWSFVTKPANSNATITNPSSEQASFVPDVTGSYIIRLTVSDGVYDPVQDEVSVTVTEPVLQGKAPVANAGDDTKAYVGSTFELDGSNSSDEDGDALSYQWELTGKPANSTATITDDTKEKASFTPDVAGTYVFRLTISDGIHDPVYDEVTINVEKGAFILNEDINEDLIIKNIFDDSDKPDCKVTEDISINAKLTIEPGVILEIESDKSLYVSSSGILHAVGEENNKIIFTGTEKTKGFWKGIEFYSDNINNQIAFAEIQYAGSTSFYSSIPETNLLINNGSKLKINNVVISNGGGYGMILEDGAELLNFADNAFSNNTEAAIQLGVDMINQLDEGSVFTDNNGRNVVEVINSQLDDANNDHTWPAFNDGTKYFVTGNIDIYSSLTISAGAVFEFDSDLEMYIGSGGKVIAEGTLDSPVIFTAKDKTAGFWRGIEIYSDNINNKFNYVEVSYAGSTPFYDGEPKSNIYLNNSAKLEITNSWINNGAGYGLIAEDGAELIDFSNNSFENNISVPLQVAADMVGKLDANSTFTNNGKNKVEIIGSELDLLEEVTWNAFTDGTKYYISGIVDIQSGLKIMAGAQFEFKSDILLYVGSSGYMIAKGTADNYVVFTGEDQSQNGTWKGISFYSDNLKNEFEYVKIAYGGSSERYNYKTNLYLENSTKLKISNVIISNSGGYGIVKDDGALLTVSDVSYNNNTTGDFLDLSN